MTQSVVEGLKKYQV